MQPATGNRHPATITIDLSRSGRIERLLLALALLATQFLLFNVVRSGVLVEASRTLETHTSRWVIVLTFLLQLLVVGGLIRLIRNRHVLLTVGDETVTYRSASVPFTSIARLGFYQPVTRTGLSGWYSIELHDGRVVRFDVHPRDRHSGEVSAALEAIEQRSRRRWVGRGASARSFRDFLGALRRGTGGRTWSWIARSLLGIQSHAAELNDPLYRWTAPLFYVPLIAVVITIVYLLTPGIRLHYGVVKTPEGMASGLAPMPRLLIGLLVMGWVFTALGVNALVVLMRTQTRNREAFEAQLNAAREVQMRLLPLTPPAMVGFELSAACLPALEVGGDYYDFIRSPTGRLVVAIGDVSGKGLPAAMLMTMVKGCLTTVIQHGESLDRAAALLNRSILEASPERTFVTMALAELDPGRGTIHLVRAGHNAPLLLRASGVMEWIAPEGVALGMRLRATEERRWQTAELQLAAGDTLLFYTDGVTEEIGADGSQYGSERLGEIVKRSRATSLAEMKSAIVADVQSFRAGESFSDDLTLVLIRRS